MYLLILLQNDLHTNEKHVTLNYIKNERKLVMARPSAGLLKDLYPEVAKQLVDKSLLNTLSKGSDKIVEWECSLGHRWETRPYNRTSAKTPTGCPVCTGKKILIGYNDIATTAPEVAALFADQSLVTQVTKTSNKRVEFICPTDPTHHWKAPIPQLTVNGTRCPYCSGRKRIKGVNDIATTHPDLAAELADQKLIHTIAAKSSRKVEWICSKNNNHKWTATPYARSKNGTGCPYCSGRYTNVGINDIGTTHPEIAKTLVDPSMITKLSAGSAKKVLWQCEKDPQHQWSATVYHRIYRSGCPICSNHQIIDGINDIATTHPQYVYLFSNPEDAKTVSAGSGIDVTWQCPEIPEHQWIAPPYKIISDGLRCPECYRQSRSGAEQDLLQIVRQLCDKGTNIIVGDRTLLKDNNEIDIVIPSLGIAIEYNGVYWHSTKVRTDPKYHLEKSKALQAKGYNLIHIWEDDWNRNSEVIIRSLAHKLHATHKLPEVLPNIDPSTYEKVFARKLTPDVPDKKEIRQFYEVNHIQGYATATKHYVLRDNNGNIRAAIALRSPRNNARMKRKAGQWEIQRYATQGNIVGGFSKLLKFAEKQMQNEGIELNQWISFSDNDISDGNLYKRNGFTLDEEIKPNYKYIGPYTKWKRAPKEAFQKKKFRTSPDLLWDDSWTEREAAEQNELYRVYDSGKKRWVKSV